MTNRCFRKEVVQVWHCPVCGVPEGGIHRGNCSGVKMVEPGWGPSAETAKWLASLGVSDKIIYSAGYDPALSTPIERLTSMSTVHNLNYGGTEMCEERERDYQLFEAAVFNRKTGEVLVSIHELSAKSRDQAYQKVLVSNASDLVDADMDDLVVAVRPFV